VPDWQLACEPNALGGTRTARLGLCSRARGSSTPPRPPIDCPNEALSRHRFPLLMYSSIMAVIAAPIVTHSALPSSLGILLVIVLLAAGYLIGRNYVSTRSNRRNWK
jgi:hypothetical protein